MTASPTPEQASEPQMYYCFKCGFFGDSEIHSGCNFFASISTEPHTIFKAMAAEISRLRSEVERLAACLADCVVKATQYGTQEGGFIAYYILPTGPLHRAMPLLEEMGIVVRPGSDGRKPLTSEQEAALAEFTRKMQEEVIPELARKENDERWPSLTTGDTGK